MTGPVTVRRRRANMIWKKRRMKNSRMSLVRRRMMKVCGMTTRTKGSGARRKNRMIASD